LRPRFADLRAPLIPDRVTFDAGLLGLRILWLLGARHLVAAAHHRLPVDAALRGWNDGGYRWHDGYWGRMSGSTAASTTATVIQELRGRRRDCNQFYNREVNNIGNANIRNVTAGP
jgi:hypothetical protein